MRRVESSHGLDAAHRQLREHGTIQVELETVSQLLDGEGRDESGVDALVGMLASARRLPETLVIRVVVGDGDYSGLAVETAFREDCRNHSALNWREALTIRRNGFRQLPRAVLFAATFGLLASGAGFLADSLGGYGLGAMFLYVLAGILTIGAWASAWLPIEQLLFDWRAPAHLAGAYELLADAQVEFVQRPARLRRGATREALAAGA